MSKQRCYKPDGMSMWDTWCVEHDGVAHMYYLQFHEPGSPRPVSDGDWQGHAVSRDLIHWEECPYAHGPSERPDDDMQPWTGCCIYDKGRFNLFYTMRGKAAPVQKIGLATSPDGYTFTKYEGNPIVFPGDRYINDTEACGCVDCRDMVVVPYEGQYIGYFVTRVKGSSPSSTACIACAVSRDMFTWEQRDPVFVPGNMACVEAHDVFYLDGRWYLTCLVGHGYGNRGFYSDPYISNGTIYAVSDSPFGPFRELEDDNVLIGGGCGYSCKSLMFKGKRYLIFTQRFTGRLDDTASRPYELKTDEAGRLYPAFPFSLPEARLGEPADLSALGLRHICAHPAWNFMEGEWKQTGSLFRGSAKTGWQEAEIIAGCDDFSEIEAEVTLLSGSAAGIALRPWDRPFALEDTGIILDHDFGKVFCDKLGNMNHCVNCRRFPVEYGRQYLLHVTRCHDRLDVFIDDKLYLQLSVPFDNREPRGWGVLVDRGEAEIKILSVLK